MRGITYVQAFQYWTKTFAIALPACLLLIHLGGLPERAALFGAGAAAARRPAGSSVELDDAAAGARSRRRRRTRSTARPQRAAAGEERVLPAGPARCCPPDASVPVAEGTDGADRRGVVASPWRSGGDASPVFVYSLLLATFLGTMGLPHILVRFYTNPDGPAARRTTVRVLGLLALFYRSRVVYGAARARARAASCT